MAQPPQDGSKALDAALKEFLGSQGPATPRPSAAPPLPANAALKTPPPERTPDPPSLRTAYDQVLEHDAAKKRRQAEAGPTIWQRIRAPLVLLAMLGAAAYVWLGDPSWLRAPPHIELTAPRSTTSARRQLVAIALEIDDYRRTTGHVPRQLTDLGLQISHVQYLTLPNGRFELSIGRGPHGVTYRGNRTGADAALDSVVGQ